MRGKVSRAARRTDHAHCERRSRVVCAHVREHDARLDDVPVEVCPSHTSRRREILTRHAANCPPKLSLREPKTVVPVMFFVSFAGALRDEFPTNRIITNRSGGAPGVRTRDEITSDEIGPVRAFRVRCNRRVDVVPYAAAKTKIDFCARRREKEKNRKTRTDTAAGRIRSRGR